MAKSTGKTQKVRSNGRKRAEDREPATKERRAVKIARHERKLRHADERRAYAIAIVDAKEAQFTSLRGKAKAAALAAYERAKIQQARIDKKRETRKRLAGMTYGKRQEARSNGERQFNGRNREHGIRAKRFRAGAEVSAEKAG